MDLGCSDIHQIKPILNYSAARPYFEIWAEKKKKTTCKLTWAKDRRAGESGKLFEHAADVRDSANTEYSTLSHIESCALNEICPVCV